MTTHTWARSGLAYLTGEPDGPADFSRAPVLDVAAETLANYQQKVATLAQGSTPAPTYDTAELLAGRAALNGFRRRGQTSAGGAARLIRAGDGWFALSLPRPEDAELVPALVGDSAQHSITTPAWRIIESAAAGHTAAYWVERCRMLGLGAAIPGEASDTVVHSRARGFAATPRRLADLLVVDLSSLWAGPLCTRLLADAGATVVKVESPRRPDGTRRGHPDFFTWMHSGKLSYAVDFDTSIDSLTRLLAAADVIVEASRPAALRRRGLAADQIPAKPGQVWLRITAHGTSGEAANWIGFGDDAAVAGGLTAGSPTAPVFCGDAIADPLTGIESAKHVVNALHHGGGVEIDVSLASTAARYAAAGVVATTGLDLDASRPSKPQISGSPPALGADNQLVDTLVNAVHRSR